MNSMPPDKREMWKAALRNGASCLEPAQLEAFHEGRLTATERSALESHLAACAHCRTELALYSEFVTAAERPDEAAAAGWIASRLHTGRPAEPRVHWWTWLWSGTRMRTLSLAVASVLVLLSAGLYYRSLRQPDLGGGEAGEWRSGQIEAISPAPGAALTPPVVFEWKGVPGASSYEIQVFEVDRTLLHKAHSASSRYLLPADVTGGLSAPKSLLWQVSAIDSQGRKLAESSLRTCLIEPRAAHP